MSSYRKLCQQFGTVCRNVCLYIYIYIYEMVPTWSEALRGLWGNRAGKNKEKGETSSQSPTMVELLNEKTAQMEKEM
jgi:hypothetical protein